MSTYNRFRGFYRFPKDSGIQVYKNVVGEVNRLKQGVFERAVSMNLAMKALSPTARPAEVALAARAAAKPADDTEHSILLRVALGDLYNQCPRGYTLDPGEGPEIWRLVAVHCSPADLPPPSRLPLFFPEPGARRLGECELRDGTGGQGEWWMEFSEDFDSLDVVCDSNNHVVERVLVSPMFRFFTKCLRDVPWVEGTGGALEYSDEYSGVRPRLIGLMPPRRPDMEGCARRPEFGM